jgi:hypothetical protein
MPLPGRLRTRPRGEQRGPAAQTIFRQTSWVRSRDLLYDPATMWQAYVRFSSGSTTRADVAEDEEDARKALEGAMNQLKSNGIATVGPSLVVTKDDLEFIKLEQKQQER